ncbi:MAG: carboxypeptidase regulatory-like domain-containing protein [Bacteroidetes bacterium]|nr:carboxypeptidase regulatory-like domain-containing protein [Bacteroidota bacterium]
MKNTGLWARPCPHKGTLFTVFMGLMMIAGMASAYDSTFDDLGLGFASGYCAFSTSPNSYDCIGTQPFLFNVKYPGNVSMSIDLFGVYTSGSLVWYIRGLNGTVWVECGDYAYSSGSNIINASCYSNQGIYAMGCKTGCYSTHAQIRSSTSTITYVGSPDYFIRSYTAGSSYIIPMVNRYYPQITTMSFSDPVYGSPIYATNTTSLGDYGGYYYTPFRAACDIPSGIESATVFNVAPLDLTYQSFPISLNMTAIQSLNFTSFSDAPSTSIIANPGVAHNFSFTINHPEGVTGVSWFLDGGMVSTGNAYNTAYMFNQSITGVYNLEVFVDDTNCGRSIYAQWYINVGQLINLIGTIRDVNSNLPIQYANVILQSVPLSYLSSSLTDSVGGYSFSGLAAGNYNLTVGADGYNSYNTSFALAYGSQNTTTYRKDYSLAATYSIGDWTLQAIDHDTLGGVSGYNLTLYWSGVKVLEVRDGVQVYKAYYYYFNTTYTGSSFDAYITQIPIGYTYTAKIDKVGYVGWPSFASPAVISRTFTVLNPSYVDPVYLKTTATTTTTTPSTTTLPTTTTTTMPVCHGSESNTCYAFDGNQTGCLNAYVILFGGNIHNCVYDSGPGYCDVDSIPCGVVTTTTTTIATTTTRPPTPSGSCTGNYTDSCYTFDDDQAACVVHFMAYGDFGYQCFYDPGTGFCDANTTSCEYTKPTTTTLAPGTTTTTRKPTTTTLAPTTTTSSTAPPTTLNSTANYHPTPASYDCNNVTAHIYAGNWTQASWCAFVLPLGGEWAVAMVILFCCFIAYANTKNYVAVVLTALLLSTAFVQLYPPIFWTVVIPFSVAIGITVVFFFLYNRTRQKHKTAYTEDFGE